ncbi:hypothetical protein DYB32_001231 [Aphanomyces invadans]|uniref:CNH domain-containing protein n=1 Tax=Aphanomyces invadans TaxID=157072 RepID=A0A3R6VGP8_9STRA|nr:hypothetical protein DYB32_001231 [Aphanomyces invadans]
MADRAYDVVDVESDKAYRGVKKAERVLSSIMLSASTPTLYVGDSSASLHAFTVHNDKNLRFHQQLKKVYHDNSTLILDSWGVCTTIMEGKLATLPLPLDKDSLAATCLDETKGATHLSAHEPSRVLCCLVKQNLMVYDWSVQGKLQLRSSHDLTVDKSNVAHSVLCLGGSQAIVQFKKKSMIVLDLDTGAVLNAKLPSVDSTLFVSRVPGVHTNLDNVLVATKDHGIIFAWDVSRHSMMEVGRLTWPTSSVPKAAPVAHHPFILVPFVDRVDVFNAASFHAVQSIPIKSVSQVNVVTTLGTADLHRPMLLLLAPPFSITLLRMRPLVDQLKYADAVGLCSLCPDECHLPAADLDQLHLNFALQLFQLEDYDTAFQQFVLGHTPLHHVLTLFPEELLPRSFTLAPVFPQVPVVLGNGLTKALRALPSFLTSIRSALTGDALVLCDTVLLKTHVLNNSVDDLTAFSASSNAADLGESELFLRVHGQWQALLALYKHHGLHRKALDVLDELHTNDPVEYEQPLAQYLTELSDAPLVFEYSRRLLTTRPNAGIAIFTHRHHHHATSIDLDPALVLQHLKSIDVTTQESSPMATSDLPLSNGTFLAISYLSQVIYANQVELPSSLHDELVYLLLDAIDTAQRNKTPKKEAFHVRVHLQRDPVLGPLRKHLLTFLQSPLAMYHPERLLSRMHVDMLEERAVLLANMGRHEEVLRLYLHEIRDAALAETYCNECYTHRITDASIYTLFLQTYLRPPTPAVGRLRSSMSLLTSGIGLHFVAAFMLRHAHCIDVATALELLPPSVEAAAVAAYLERVVELKVEQKRHVQVQKQLLKIENLHVRSALNAAKQGSVRVDVDSTCDVCARPVERGPVLCHPNGTLLHYACQTSS